MDVGAGWIVWTRLGSSWMYTPGYDVMTVMCPPRAQPGLTPPAGRAAGAVQPYEEGRDHGVTAASARHHDAVTDPSTGPHGRGPRPGDVASRAVGQHPPGPRAPQPGPRVPAACYGSPRMTSSQRSMA